MTQRCVVIDAGTGAIVDMEPQPADTSTCALVLASPDELVSPFRLTTDEAAVIGTGILGVWAIAWAYRVIAQFLNQPEEREEP